MNHTIGDSTAKHTEAGMTDADGGQSVDLAEMRKRSVVIAGHRTSVSLENAFWNALKSIATARGITVNQMVTQIDSGRSGNLSSAIRLFVLESYRNGAGSPQAG